MSDVASNTSMKPYTIPTDVENALPIDLSSDSSIQFKKDDALSQGACKITVLPLSQSAGKNQSAVTVQVSCHGSMSASHNLLSAYSTALRVERQLEQDVKDYQSDSTASQTEVGLAASFRNMVSKQGQILRSDRKTSRFVHSDGLYSPDTLKAPLNNAELTRTLLGSLYRSQHVEELGYDPAELEARYQAADDESARFPTKEEYETAGKAVHEHLSVSCDGKIPKVVAEWLDLPPRTHKATGWTGLARGLWS